MSIGQIAETARDLTTIIALLVLLVKPIRERVLGDKLVRDGQKCLLRAEILRTYYNHKQEKTLRQYEYENLCYCIKAYKAMKGNSFIDRIYKEMQEWNVVS